MNKERMAVTQKPSIISRSHARYDPSASSPFFRFVKRFKKLGKNDFIYLNFCDNFLDGS